MDASSIEQVLGAWAIAWSSHDTEKVLALFTDDCVYEDVTFGVVNRGKTELRAFVDGIFVGVPDFKVELTTRFVADTSAAMEWVMSGTHRGEFQGMPATGKEFSIRGVTVVELSGRKIRRNSDYWDGGCKEFCVCELYDNLAERRVVWQRRPGSRESFWTNCWRGRTPRRCSSGMVCSTT